MVVNVAVPVVHTPDGVIVLSRSRLRLWKREQRAVRFTRVLRARTGGGFPYLTTAQDARRAAHELFTRYARAAAPRGAEVRVRFTYE